MTFNDSKVTRQYTVAGTLAVAAGALKFPVPFPADLVAVYVNVGTAPVGPSVLVDVNKNGTTIFTDQALRPAILTTTTSASRVADRTPLDPASPPSQANFASGYYPSDISPSAANFAPLASFVAGDTYSVDVDQIGTSTTEGSNLSVTLVFDPR